MDSFVGHESDRFFRRKQPAQIYRQSGGCDAGRTGHWDVSLSTSAPAVTQSALASHSPAESTGAAGDSCNWRTLALALGALLAQTDTQRVIDAEGQAVEPAEYKTAHDQDALAGRDSIVGLG
jgi:hypothetical protein